MQASWGAENGAPGPLRGGKLFGEKGTWKVSMECSVPDVFTYADKEVRGGDDPDVKFRTKQYVQKGPVQALSTKKPAEMDICANGMAHVIRTFSSPDKHTMADHDHGVVWPPPRGHEQTGFMSMVKEPKPRVGEVNGIMVGYKGHVPRARDKVGGCPLGGLPQARGETGFPAPDETKPTMLPGMGAQTSKLQGENSVYVSTAHEVQFRTAAAIAGLHNTSPTKIHSPVMESGFIPRYAGHKPMATKKGVGGSVYGYKHKDKKKLDYTYMTQGNDDIQAMEDEHSGVEGELHGSLNFESFGASCEGKPIDTCGSYGSDAAEHGRVLNN